MLKSRLYAVRTFAFSALLLMGSSAFAANPAPMTSDFLSPLKMPRYEQWRKLSPQARGEFIEDVQTFLLRADAMARSGGKAKDSREAQIIQRLFDIWIETAEAKVKSKGPSNVKTQQQPYCINQGVVKPLSDCDTKLGYKMHDFDTNEKLAPLGEAAKCQAPEKPCSPFFGFTAEGGMFCSSKNLTRDCAQKSEQEGTISLASTLTACEKGSPGIAKVDCGKLKTFFDEQMSAVDSLCKDAPKRFACGILKDQIQAVMAEKEGKAPAASQASAPTTDAGASSDADENQVPELANHVKGAVQMENGKAPCPPEQAAMATAQRSDNATCPHKAYPQTIKVPLFDTLTRAISEGATKKSTCSEMDLPNGGTFKLDFTQGQGLFRAGSNSTPVAVDDVGLTSLVFASTILSSVYKIPPEKLLASYIPKEAIKDAGKLKAPTQDAPEFQATGLTSIDGTQIRFAYAEDLNTLLLTIKRPGDKENSFPIDLNKLKQAQEQAKAAAGQQK